MGRSKVAPEEAEDAVCDCKGDDYGDEDEALFGGISEVAVFRSSIVGGSVNLPWPSSLWVQ
jgi:hypothetical protein